MSGSEAAPGRLGLRSIPFGAPFLPVLARHLLERFPAPETLARALVLLPSARAKRGLTEAFLAATEGRALLLPRIAAVAQVDEDEALGVFAEEEGPELPPAIGPLARRLALARLLLPTSPGGAAAADALARDLARVLDTLTAHGVDPGALADVALPELAAHRARGLQVLAAISEHWPALLAERGRLDPVARREALLAGLLQRWERAPPPYPVIAAGFAAAPPAVARLLARIARLPEGEVILPGLDPAVEDHLWEAIGRAPTHPLHGLHGLLEAMQATPSDARALASEEARSARSAAVAEAFRPAGVAAAAPHAPPSGLFALEAAGPEAEALAIALAMRRALETPGRTAALVTRSRGLAARVVAALSRWGLSVDDSAGEPLSLQPAGAFLLALAAAAAGRFRPVVLLALLKHPFAGGETSEGRASWLASARWLDLALRGPAPAAGLAGIASRLIGRHAELKPWWEEVAVQLAPLEALFEGDAAPTMADLCASLAAVGEALAGSRLWSGPDGRALGALLGEIAETADAARLPVGRVEIEALLHALLRDTPVRAPWRTHPRLLILGPIEARLQHADLLILGDMNEGSWPAVPAPDPWMAPAVRKALGLPPAEARIGLEAHDLLSATAADTILLTRARRDSGALTVSSRFLLRLEAAFGPLPRDAELEAALALDGVGRTIRLPMPAPAPPAAERPRLLRVTEADMLAADPFSFYARRMLGLRELDPLEQAADAAVKGTAVHRILERLVKEGAARREAIIADVLEEIGGDPALKHLWGPRLARMVDEAEAWLERDAAEGWLPEEAERKLASTFDGIRIEGKADRIDRDDDGWLRIVDYKTGKLPDQKDLRAGHFRQLPLLRLLVESDPAFADAKVAVLEYWKLSGGLNGGKRQGGNWTIEREVFEGELRALLGRYLWGDAPFQPKVSPVFARNYRAFDQLARIEEWL